MLEIKVCNEGGVSKVELLAGISEGEETVICETAEVGASQELTITVPDETQVSVGQVMDQVTDETATGDNGEGEQSEASQAGGEAESAGGSQE